MAKLNEINKKIDKLLAEQKKLMAGQKRIEREEKEELAEESEIINAGKEEIIEQKEVLAEEKEGLNELKQLKDLEVEINKSVMTHPLIRITIKDIAKGAIGAFVGTVTHFTFLYGIEVADKIDMTRATILFPLSYLFGAIFVYATGFRTIKDKKILMFAPVRLTVLYVTAILVTIGTLYLFNPLFGVNLTDSYKQVATTSLSALIGAITADLIGKE